MDVFIESIHETMDRPSRPVAAIEELDLEPPEEPSIAELSGEQPFFDMERVIPYLLYPSIQPGHR